MRSLAWHRNTGRDLDRDRTRAAFVCELIPGGRAWQRMPAPIESGQPCPLGLEPPAGQPEPSIAWCWRLDLLWPLAAMRHMTLAAMESEQFRGAWSARGNRSICAAVDLGDECKVASRSGCSARLGSAGRGEPADASSVLFAARRLAEVSTRKVRAGEPVGSWAPKSCL